MNTESFPSLGHDSLKTSVLGECQQKPLEAPELWNRLLFYSLIKANPSGDIHGLIHSQVLNSLEFLY